MKRLFALAALFVATPVAAQQSEPFAPDCSAIAAMLDGMVAEGRTVGVSTLVYKDGEETCFAVAGDAERETNRPFTRDTLVQIFSMTKPVTGVALMQLWEEGRFRLDDPLEWHLPEYAETQVLVGETSSGEAITRAPKRTITVRDVLRHTAGFSYGPWGEPQNAGDRMWAAIDPLSADKTLAEFSAAMAKVPLSHDPGTHWSYSAGVDVQARLVEVLSGQPFAEYVAEHIFAPLGMEDSAWQRDTTDLSRLARIYVTRPDG